MYKLKNVAKRGSALLGAVGLLTGIGASALPAFASANDLNPLTERSLTLSSSSPGWAFTDGSGNGTYAPPNSGANGQKTGNYFSFRVSTNSAFDGADPGTDPDNPIKAMSFQYCVNAAGNCEAPGDNTPNLTDPNDMTGASGHSDLNVNYTGTATEITNSDDPQTGTITLTTNNVPAGTDHKVVGSGTSFTDLRAGQIFKTAGGNTYTIASIQDDTHLTMTTAAVADEDGGGSGVAFTMNNFVQVVDPTTGVVRAVPGYTNSNPKYIATGKHTDIAEAAKDVGGNFIVMYDNGGTWTESTGWTASTSNQEETSRTGMQNTIILQNSTGLGLPATTQVKVLFFATNTDYITNPGKGAFFVKINTFKHFDALGGGNTLADNIAKVPSDVIDGGVTVANVMNQSIQITTKVLETMEFSVGTVDPDTLSSTDAADDNTQSTFEAAEGDAAPGTGNPHAKHTPCNLILKGMNPSDPQNVLQLGNQGSESSLSTEVTYATHSYWRLSSNSSAGATVYYSGHTLSNTSGDEIQPIGKTATASATGSEQFGLALDTTALTGGHGFDDATNGVDYTTAGANEHGADDPLGVAPTINNSTLTDLGAVNTPPWDYTALNKSYHTPRLDPLVPTNGTTLGVTDYGHGSGTITNAGSAKFAFDPMSDTIPAAIATESNQVVDCVTGKMRYIANIAATTPAGIYTTKVNYIAAPQY